MMESESIALPLGDTPTYFRTQVVSRSSTPYILHVYRFFCKRFDCLFHIFLFFFFSFYLSASAKNFKTENAVVRQNAAIYSSVGITVYFYRITYENGLNGSFSFALNV